VQTATYLSPLVFLSVFAVEQQQAGSLAGYHRDVYVLSNDVASFQQLLTSVLTFWRLNVF
jgi:hypothetical protein